MSERAAFARLISSARTLGPTGLSCAPSYAFLKLVSPRAPPR